MKGRSHRRRHRKHSKKTLKRRYGGKVNTRSDNYDIEEVNPVMLIDTEQDFTTGPAPPTPEGTPNVRNGMDMDIDTAEPINRRLFDDDDEVTLAQGGRRRRRRTHKRRHHKRGRKHSRRH